MAAPATSDDGPVVSKLRFSYLGSGSRGNAALIEAGDTCVMLDCGFSAKETARRVRRLGRKPGELSAVLITHEHGDHVAGAVRFCRQHDIELWMTPGTRAAVRDSHLARLQLVNCHEKFNIGDLEIQPTPVPHDAREPCQYVFSDGNRRLGVLTDTGHVSKHMLQIYSGCDALALECNHAPELLAAGPYPAHLKNRVGSNYGHLSNEQAAGMVTGMDCSRLQHVVAVHLSDTNNTTDKARAALAGALECGAGDVHIADQDEGLEWLDVD
ncbi:MAG: MBL fold metallo-hydrolase [Gammaproteobacteria bacterium]|nr:MBL fold metallo-hydrolase [Gammaproteobacteria bacterium]NNF61453.1 MBL fold metallo-hydrolase [Gammaproteobacteria bacterium]NNM21181.1 MBL fold metallo-hydrolase [Gammaproteobacteria bacterium]